MASIISFTFREAVADVEYKGKGIEPKRELLMEAFILYITYIYNFKIIK